MHDWKWSPSEKAVARKAFDLAVSRELDEVIREAKRRAAGIQDVAELWNLERWLGQRRQEIDSKYDYRYSVLPMVFAALIREGRLSAADLQGLEQKKLASILLAAGF